MMNFIFFILGVMIGGLAGITTMCCCIIAKNSDEHLDETK